jgi:HAD superfamily hydrolase (TIGR01509 family)
VSVPEHSPIALLFDLDGVLVHSMPLHTEAWRQYLAGLGVEVEDLERSMHGKRNPELVRQWFGEALAEDVVLQHGTAKEQLFRDLMVAEDPALFRVPGLLEFLERHKDVPKAIGSNAELANVDFVLDHLGLRRYFEVVVHGDEIARPKPFPDIYLRAAERLGYSPADCIVFEDSPTGVKAARAASMRVVGVETTPTDFRGLDLRIQDFRDPQLDAWLRAQAGQKELTRA